MKCEASKFVNNAMKQLTHSEKTDRLVEYSHLVFPDPFDIYEDMLAARLGIHRHPDTPQAEWRKLRVEAGESPTASFNIGLGERVLSLQLTTNYETGDQLLSVGILPLPGIGFGANLSQYDTVTDTTNDF